MEPTVEQMQITLHCLIAEVVERQLVIFLTNFAETSSSAFDFTYRCTIEDL